MQPSPNTEFNKIHDSAQMLNFCRLMHTPTIQFLSLDLQTLYLASSLPLSEGRAGTAWEPSEQ
jgi:hypothetical protein